MHNISVLHDSVASLLSGLYSLYKTESEPIKGTLHAVAALVEYRRVDRGHTQTERPPDVFMAQKVIARSDTAIGFEQVKSDGP